MTFPPCGCAPPEEQEYTLTKKIRHSAAPPSCEQRSLTSFCSPKGHTLPEIWRNRSLRPWSGGPGRHLLRLGTPSEPSPFSCFAASHPAALPPGGFASMRSKSPRPRQQKHHHAQREGPPSPKVRGTKLLSLCRPDSRSLGIVASARRSQEAQGHRRKARINK